jgi:hypothetical protein
LFYYELSETEQELALAEGQRRQSENEKKKLKGRNLGPASGEKALQAHLMGARGEVAVASYLGLKQELFTELNPVKGSCDLPFSIDVKTRSNHAYDLLCFLDEKDNKKLVLVTDQLGKLIIHGWILAKDAKQQKYRKSYSPGRFNYAIPQSDLKPISQLRQLVKNESDH